MNVVAISDALRLVAGITAATAARSQRDLGATEHEVHGLAYLACELAHWTTPDLAWKYEFHVTTQAEPFAPELSIALRALRANGMVEDAGPVLCAMPSGEALLTRLSTHVAAHQREPFLQAALDAAVLMPIPLVLRALSHEPTVARAATTQTLLDETALNVLAEYYEALRVTAGSDATLLSLTELWVQYLLVTAGPEAA